MRRREARAIVADAYPQIPYHLAKGTGSYGEPITAVTAVVGAASALLVPLIGQAKQSKIAQAQLDQQAQLAKDQMLINAQLAAADAAAQQQHTANMPLYLLGGVAGLVVVGVIIKAVKKG